MTKESSFHSTPMKNALIYTDAYLDYNYGPMHPLRVIRLKLTFELIKAYGLLDLPSVQIISTIKADEEDRPLFERDGLSKGAEMNLSGWVQDPYENAVEVPPCGRKASLSLQIPP